MLSAFFTIVLKKLPPTLLKVYGFFLVFFQIFSQGKSPELVECSFDNPTEKIMIKIQRFFSQKPEKNPRLLIFSKKVHLDT